MTPDNSLEQTRIREIAKEYRERGYRVTVEPDVDVRPEFLADFRADLIAVTDDDRVVIEVVAHGAAGERRLTELARTIEPNRVAHGYKSPEVEASVVEHLIAIAEELSEGEPSSHSG